MTKLAPVRLFAGRAFCVNIRDAGKQPTANIENRDREGVEARDCQRSLACTAIAEGNARFTSADKSRAAGAASRAIRQYFLFQIHMPRVRFFVRLPRKYLRRTPL